MFAFYDFRECAETTTAMPESGWAQWVTIGDDPYPIVRHEGLGVITPVTPFVAGITQVLQSTPSVPCYGAN